MKTWISLLLVAGLMQCPAADFPAALAELRSALKEELKPVHTKGSTDSSSRQTMLKSLADQLPEKEPLEEQLQQTAQTLGQIRSVTQSKKAQDFAQALINEIQSRSKEAAGRLQESFDKSVAKCIRESLKATEPKELDVQLREIAELKRKTQTLRYQSADSQTAFSSAGLPAAEEFLNQFQDLLVAAEKGTAVNGPAQRMKGLNSSRQLIEFIPRTELDELLETAFSGLKTRHIIALSDQEFDQKLQQIIDGVTKPEELGSALKQLLDTIATQQKATGSMFSGGVFNSAKTINRIHEDILAGRATTVDISLLTQNEDGDRTGKIKHMLVRFLMPRVLGADPEIEMKEGETLSVFLIRTVAFAIKSRNWTQLSKILDVCERLPTNLSPLNATDTSAFKQFLAAQNLERTHQYPSAVAAYHAALKTGSQNIPLDFIGEHLTTIEKEHPKEYQAGVELANNTPTERPSPYPRMMTYPPGYPASRIERPPPIQLLPVKPDSNAAK